MEGGKCGLGALNNSGVPECLVVGPSNIRSRALMCARTNIHTHTQICTHLWFTLREVERGDGRSKKHVNLRDGRRAAADFYRAETFTARRLAFACKRDRVPSFRRPRTPTEVTPVPVNCLFLFFSAFLLLSFISLRPFIQ